MDTILQNIETFVKQFVTNYILNPVTAFMQSIPWWADVLILLGVLIIVLFGIVAFIKKAWKFLLIVAIIGAAGFAVWYFFLKDKGQSDETLESILVSIKLIKTFIF